MQGTIGVAVSGSPPSWKSRVVGVFSGAAVAGGMILGAMMSGVGVVTSLDDSLIGGVLVGLAVVVLVGVSLAGYRGRMRRRFTITTRQVNRANFDEDRLLRVSAFWGVQLGFGIVTRVNSWSFWLLLLFVTWRADLMLGVIAGGLFGLCRSVGLLPIGVTRSGMPARPLSVIGEEGDTILLPIAATAGLGLMVIGNAIGGT